LQNLKNLVMWSNMQISQERLKTFKELYKEINGIELSDAEAYESANNLVQYVLLLMKPLEPIEMSEEA
jgi:hypothetical protein